MTRRLWHFVQEPKTVKAVMFGIWLCVVGIGITNLVAPPTLISHELGPLLTVIWGAFLLIGGILGAVGCLPGWWWVERSGIIATITGSLIYLFVALFLQVTQAGNRIIQAEFTIIVIGFFITRLLRIRGTQLDPMRGPNAH